MFRLIFTLCLIGLLTTPLHSQKNKKPPKPRSPFNAGITLGFNSSQLDGDYQSGYDKFGFSGGLQSRVYLKPSLDLTIDLLFSQRGSKPGNSRNTKTIALNLNYAEVNLLLNILLARSEEGFPKNHFQAGISFARLLNHRLIIDKAAGGYIPTVTSGSNPSDRSSFTEITDFFNENDFAVTGGFAFHAGPQFTFTPRFHYSLSLLFNPKFIPEKMDRSMRSFLFSIHGTYLILNPYKKRK